MKTKVLLSLFALALFGQAIVAQSARGPRIGYIDMEYILENVAEYQEANAQLESKVQKWKVEIEEKRSAIEQMKKDLSVEKVLLTKELIEEREEEIKLLEEEMLEYQQDRFGPQGDLVVQRNLLVKPIQDQVFNAVQEIAKNKRYDFVFDKSADVVMLYSAERYDISDLVLRSITREVKKTERANKTAKAKERFESGEVEVDPEVEARKEAAANSRAERQRQLEERKAAKIKEREEKKKAYEERRKKLLEEREAKKKAKEAEEKEDNNTEENEENN
ncbi:OmpH family outer membrane protein [Sungkyunkwania multivorans]|uniref:OmpH family outer membrane protein n=1 Tax=Sungkyunkwania multivorans TaxID=1173618 RepID=A0ABW3D235_9FLAO